jgi:hypothetical protein
MNGFSVGGWHDVVDPERSRMEIVEAYQASISDNAMQRKGGPEKSSSDLLYPLFLNAVFGPRLRHRQALL